VIRYRDEAEAIAIANDSLTAAGGLVERLRAGGARRSADSHGTMWMNDYHVFNDLTPSAGTSRAASVANSHVGTRGVHRVKHVHVGSEGYPALRPGNRCCLSYPRTTALSWTGPTASRSVRDELPP